MGRRQKKGRGNHQKRERNDRPKMVTADGLPVHDDGRVVLRENALFNTFYKAQQLVPDEEWESLMSFLQKDLPSSFRFVGCRWEAIALQKLLKERYLSKMGDLTIDGAAVEPPVELPWYPAGLGYQMTLSRHVIRRQPILSAFHNFLVSETEMGNISRQETVSMIPPLLLDIESHHKVLDMCAAPGSKTAQLIEMLHSGVADDAMPSGFVLANDFDNKRCYLLVHQSLKRLTSPSCMISNMDAACMPNIQSPDENGKLKNVLFDRILCDVPCSGDGTVRKNISIWKAWSLYHAYNLHKIQFRIAKRGLEILAVGGILVYSTCSLNPAENEATVYRLLEFAAGAVELVDVSDKLPGLKRRPGLHSWVILDKKSNTIASPDAVPREMQKQIPATVFPPPLSSAQDAHLERCFRILPHDQNTGGFFVAVLKKVRDLHQPKVPSASAGEESSSEPKSNNNSGCSGPPEKKPKYSGFKEDPFVFINQTDAWWDDVKEYFDIREDFPRSQMLCRCSDQSKKRTIYFVNQAVKQILQNNVGKFKFINAGMRLFSRTDEKEGRCHYRIAQESLKVIAPYLRKRIIELVSQEDVVKLLQVPSVVLDELSESTRALANDLAEGSLGLVYKKASDGRVFMLSAWRGKMSIAGYVSQESRVHILRLLGHDTTAIEEEMVRQRKNQQNRGGGSEETESSTVASA